MADVEVVTGELHKHAGNVEHLAEQIQNCAKFAQGVDFGLDTFGIVGQVFAAGCREQSHTVAQALDKAAGSVRDVGDGLNETAETYGTTENDNTSLFAGGEA